MTMVDSLRPLAALFCPFCCTVLIYLFRHRPNIREGCTLTASCIQFAIIFSMVSPVLDDKMLNAHVITITPGLAIGFRLDAFGLLFALTASFLWILVSIYSIGYMRAHDEPAQTRFYGCFSMAMFSAVSIAMAKNLVTFYLFYEALTFSTYWLVAHNEDDAAFQGAKKYLTYLILSGWFLFAAVVLTYGIAGTTDFIPGGILDKGIDSRGTLTILFVLFALGSMKAAWMPFHAWLPSAMVAPTPVSALLHAVAVVKAGVFGLVRIVCYIFGIDLFQTLGLGVVMGFFAAATMLVGSFFAIAEDNLKRRLAFSTISQLSYILFGTALLTTFGIQGAMLHIPFHGFMKITLFLCVGAVMVITGKKQISQMAGLGRQMPITMTAFAIGAAGMCGIPPVAGFISKWFLCLGTLQMSPETLPAASQAGILTVNIPGLLSGTSLICLAVILISSVLDVVYFFPIVKTAFFEKIKTRHLREQQRPNLIEIENPLYWFMVGPLVVTAILSVVFCLFPNLFFILDLTRMATESLFL